VTVPVAAGKYFGTSANTAPLPTPRTLPCLSGGLQHETYPTPTAKEEPARPRKKAATRSER